ncbi:acetate kinase [Nanchangia anserum]|uniref:Acetate kinase n=1 Tax=Nanchangia anserum TaxID=2692125 RepID=A0A8I0GDI6_9ACTO|nr:acetate kinase [Nanchangia anserum]MBD3689996.1 acetate kinase [Nanchangia anserum]QOX82203.1 acetate kinase [Nanchangia anserum]
MATQTVLVINSGSSSIKYQLVDPDSGEPIAKGLIEAIGEDSGHATHTYGEERRELDRVIADHTEGMAIMEEFFSTLGPDLASSHIVAVGHRIVQGGKYFSGPALIDEEVHDKIVDLCPLGPLHNPAHLKGIDAARKIFPDLPHVAVFDTAFFQSLPEEAARYALNREVADTYEIRRYGAHGTSHQFVSGEVTRMLGRDDLKQIVLHLGNGASASAVVNGHAVDTSMGLTPLEGLVMGSRTGDIDPAAVFHLLRQTDMGVDELDDLFNKRSGMKGLTGDNDMRRVHERIAAGDRDAADGFAIYIHRLVSYVGAYTAVMGGLDALTFTAGIGENDAKVREALCERLAFLGVRIDAEANAQRSGEARVISTPDSAVTVLVVPTNEELAIARQAMSLV